jgi:2',3'-cyclic-nucleotide 2'-phosphodiesterase (5'-nucleotidase family)
MKKNLFLILMTIFLSSCGLFKNIGGTKDDGKITITFLQINDVYEIAAMEDGKVGGMARIATLKKQLLAQNPNTLAVLSGDFLNPSVIGTLKYNGSRIKGAQMVDVMNETGIDWVTFGNHEFDLDYPDLVKRMEESKFKWTCANTWDNKTDSLQAFMYGSGDKKQAVSESDVLTFTDADGTSVKIGLFGVCLDFNKRDYVQYTDVLSTSKDICKNLSEKSDVIMAITHLNLGQDLQLATQEPKISLVMGGHEHENSYNKVGDVIIAKADANAKTAYIHRVTYNTKTKKATVASEYAAVSSIVKKWNDIAQEAFKKEGFNANEVVAVLKEPLDGKESSIRTQQNNLGTQIAQAMAAAAKKTVDCAFFNGGSVRVDDILKGNLTQYDIIRTLPYGGALVEVDMKGSLLKQILDIGENQNKGRGGYLQRFQADYNATNKQWTINKQALDENKTYHIITGEFLMSGGESNLEFLKNAEGITKQSPDPSDKSDTRNDVRKAWIAFLKK